MTKEETVQLLSDATTKIFDISAALISDELEEIKGWMDERPYITHIRFTPNDPQKTHCLYIQFENYGEKNLTSYKGYQRYDVNNFRGNNYYLRTLYPAAQEAGFTWNDFTDIFALCADFATRLGKYDALSVVLRRVSVVKITANGVDVEWNYKTDKNGTKKFKISV